MTEKKRPPLTPVPQQQQAESQAGWRTAQVRRNMLLSLADQGLKHEAEVAFKWWPTLQSTAVALCAHLGEDLKGEGSRIALCHEAVGSAVKAFNKAVNEAGRIEDGVHAFLQSVVDVADDLVQIVVYVEDERGKRHCWRQFNQAFPDWQAEFGPKAKVCTMPAPYVFGDELWAARRMLATITMTPSDFGRHFAFDLRQQ